MGPIPSVLIGSVTHGHQGRCSGIREGCQPNDKYVSDRLWLGLHINWQLFPQLVCSVIDGVAD